jgi:GntR family transcriptional repressor for pyruvate dehydrogenase complex
MERPRKIYCDVALEIEDAIVSGELHEDQILPSERKLAITFGISQRTLREALRILEEKGLIETNQTGNVVKLPTTDKISQNLNLLIRLNKVSAVHLLELRDHLDPIIAKKAAQCADAEDIKKLEQYLSDIEKNLKGPKFDWDLMLENDRKIHIFVAEITGNQLYVWLTTTLIDQFNNYINSWKNEDIVTANENFNSLSRIVDALRNRDSKAALLEAKNHVKIGKKHIKVIA